MKIIIHLEGGMVRSVVADEPTNVELNDFDIDPADYEDALPDSRGKYFVKICFLATLTPDKDAPHPKP